MLDALDRSGRAKETIVLYTGDHGYLLGQHSRFEKHCCFEPAIRAPLVMRYPEKIKPNSSTKALVEFIDIAPTILEQCGISVPPSVQGKSLLGLFDGRTEKHRDQVFIEYAENEEAAIRTQRWKLIYSTGKRIRQDGYATGRPLPGRTVQLFDLDEDPEEMRNLADDPAQATRVRDLTSRLLDHLKRTARRPEPIPAGASDEAVLNVCLGPDDVASPTRKPPRSPGPSNEASRNVK